MRHSGMCNGSSGLVKSKGTKSTKTMNLDCFLAERNQKPWFKNDTLKCRIYTKCCVDSPYFSLVSLGWIQEKIKTCNCNRCVLLGDFNARYGLSMRELPVSFGVEDVSNADIVDPVRLANGNAKALVGIWRDEQLLVLNNLKICTDHYKSKLTYRQEQSIVGIRARLLCYIMSSDARLCIRFCSSPEHYFTIRPRPHIYLPLSVPCPCSQFRLPCCTSIELGESRRVAQKSQYWLE